MKSHDSLERYLIFYEALDQKEQTIEQAKKDAEYERTHGLNEGDLAKLSNDLRSPMKVRPSDSDPMQ